MVHECISLRFLRQQHCCTDDEEEQYDHSEQWKVRCEEGEAQANAKEGDGDQETRRAEECDDAEASGDRGGALGSNGTCSLLDAEEDETCVEGEKYNEKSCVQEFKLCGFGSRKTGNGITQVSELPCKKEPEEEEGDESRVPERFLSKKGHVSRMPPDYRMGNFHIPNVSSHSFHGIQLSYRALLLGRSSLLQMQREPLSA